MLLAYDADVVCVQELDEDDCEGAFGTGMSVLGYDGKSFCRRNPLHQHGFAIFFKSHLYERVFTTHQSHTNEAKCVLSIATDADVFIFLMEIGQSW